MITLIKKFSLGVNDLSMLVLIGGESFTTKPTSSYIDTSPIEWSGSEQCFPWKMLRDIMNHDLQKENDYLLAFPFHLDLVVLCSNRALVHVESNLSHPTRVTINRLKLPDVSCFAVAFFRKMATTHWRVSAGFTGPPHSTRVALMFKELNIAIGQ